MRRYELELPVTLNVEQAAEKGRELAGQAIKAAHIESKIAEVKEQAKDDIKVLKNGLTEAQVRIARLARAVRKMEMLMPVAVEARVADDNSRVDVVRLDTGVVVQTRALTEEDRQMQIEDVLARVERDTKEAAVQEEPVLEWPDKNGPPLEDDKQEEAEGLEDDKQEEDDEPNPDELED